MFNPSSAAGNLSVTELVLGEVLRCVSVITRTKYKTIDCYYISCCSLGSHIPVMAGEGGKIFAALVGVRKKLLTTSAIHLARLNVKGGEESSSRPFLYPVSGAGLFCISMTGACGTATSTPRP